MCTFDYSCSSQLMKSRRMRWNLCATQLLWGVTLQTRKDFLPVGYWWYGSKFSNWLSSLNEWMIHGSCLKEDRVSKYMLKKKKLKKCEKHSITRNSGNQIKPNLRTMHRMIIDQRNKTCLVLFTLHALVLVYSRSNIKKGFSQNVKKLRYDSIDF